MKIYIDFVLFINFMFDFLILISVNLILKRYAKIYKIIIGSIVGSLSIFLLFINLNTFTLFIIKLFISILMIVISFGFRDFFKNFLYLYLISIILGGFIYFINNNVSYKTDGLLFINNGYSVNLILLLIISPIILYLYIKDYHKSKNIVSNIHLVTIKYNNKVYNYRGYLDTGNKLKDPYKNRAVSILYDNSIKPDRFIYIPYNTLSEEGILKGIIVDYMIIDNIYKYDNVVIGLTDNRFILDESDIILNSSYSNSST